MTQDEPAEDTSIVTLWKTIQRRFQNSVIGVLILGAVAVAAFLTNALGLWDTWTHRFRLPQLKVTDLSGANAPKPLDGYSIIKVAGGRGRTAGPLEIYPRGATINMVVSHSRDADASITLQGLELEIDKFVPGRNSAYAYKANGDDIIGAGPIEPYKFHVALIGSRVGRAMYIKDPKSSSAKPVARSSNFLDTEEPLLYSLSKADDSKPIQVRVTAEEAGLYQISFALIYSTSGSTGRVNTSPAVFIYYDGN